MFRKYILHIISTNLSNIILFSILTVTLKKFADLNSRQLRPYNI